MSKSAICGNLVSQTFKRIHFVYIQYSIFINIVYIRVCTYVRMCAGMCVCVCSSQVPVFLIQQNSSTLVWEVCVCALAHVLVHVGGCVVNGVPPVVMTCVVYLHLSWSHSLNILNMNLWNRNLLILSKSAPMYSTSCCSLCMMWRQLKWVSAPIPSWDHHVTAMWPLCGL